jgi:hypothetical protein
LNSISPHALAQADMRSGRKRAAFRFRLFIPPSLWVMGVPALYAFSRAHEAEPNIGQGQYGPKERRIVDGVVNHQS